MSTLETRLSKNSWFLWDTKIRHKTSSLDPVLIEVNQFSPYSPTLHFNDTLQPMPVTFKGETCGSHCCDYEDYHLLGCDIPEDSHLHILFWTRRLFEFLVFLITIMILYKDDIMQIPPPLLHLLYAQKLSSCSQIPPISVVLSKLQFRPMQYRESIFFMSSNIEYEERITWRLFCVSSTRVFSFSFSLSLLLTLSTITITDTNYNFNNWNIIAN